VTAHVTGSVTADDSSLLCSLGGVTWSLVGDRHPVRDPARDSLGRRLLDRPDSPLPDGQFTARAEQDNLASPPDAGFGSATTFTVRNALLKVTLNSPAPCSALRRRR
jgi:hypothetical protein